MLSNTDVKEILVLEPDRLCGAVIARTVSTTFPNARVYCESDPSVAAVMLAERAIELFVVTVRGFDLDTLTLLGVWAEHDAHRTKVLVVTPGANSTALLALRSLPIAGVFDSSAGNLHELESACRAVAAGTRYWSESVRGTAVAEHPPVEPIYLDQPGWVNRTSGHATGPTTILPRWRR